MKPILEYLQVEVCLKALYLLSMSEPVLVSMILIFCLEFVVEELIITAEDNFR